MRTSLFKVLSAIVIGCLSSISAGADDKASIILMFSQLEPRINANSSEFNGETALYIKDIFQKVDVDYRWESVLWDDQIALLKSNKTNVCGVLYYQTAEREKFAQFVGPVAYAEPTVVIGRKNQTDLMQHQSIASVLKSTSLNGVVMLNTSYGKSLDNVLETVPKDRVEYSSIRLLRMLESSEYDYTLLAEDAAKFAVQNFDIDALAIYNHYQDSRHGQALYLACAKRIDEALVNTLNTAMRQFPVVNSAANTQ